MRLLPTLPSKSKTHTLPDMSIDMSGIGAGKMGHLKNGR
jgi:hypothetical protein